MNVKLYAGDEVNVYEGVAFDKQGRETDLIVRADTLEQAKSRVSDSMADYNWTDVQSLSKRDVCAA